MKPTNLIRRIRLALAKWLLPKDVREGELFTITRHLYVNGEANNDGPWVGDILRADRVEGDRIAFSVLRQYVSSPSGFEPVNYWLIPGKNCLVKPISASLSQDEARALYERAKRESQ